MMSHSETVVTCVDCRSLLPSNTRPKAHISAQNVPNTELSRQKQQRVMFHVKHRMSWSLRNNRGTGFWATKRQRHTISARDLSTELSTGISTALCTATADHPHPHNGNDAPPVHLCLLVYTLRRSSLRPAPAVLGESGAVPCPGPSRVQWRRGVDRRRSGGATPAMSAPRCQPTRPVRQLPCAPDGESLSPGELTETRPTALHLVISACSTATVGGRISSNN